MLLFLGQNKSKEHLGPASLRSDHEKAEEHTARWGPGAARAGEPAPSLGGCPCRQQEAPHSSPEALQFLSERRLDPRRACASQRCSSGRKETAALSVNAFEGFQTKSGFRRVRVLTGLPPCGFAALKLPVSGERRAFVGWVLHSKGRTPRDEVTCVTVLAKRPTWQGSEGDLQPAASEGLRPANAFSSLLRAQPSCQRTSLS